MVVRAVLAIPLAFAPVAGDLPGPPPPPRRVADVCAWTGVDGGACVASDGVVDELVRGAFARARARTTACLSWTAAGGEGECRRDAAVAARGCATARIGPGGAALCLPRTANPSALVAAYGPGVAGVEAVSRRVERCDAPDSWTGPDRRACVRHWTRFLRFVGFGGATAKLVRVSQACDGAADETACRATTVPVLVGDPNVGGARSRSRRARGGRGGRGGRDGGANGGG